MVRLNQAKLSLILLTYDHRLYNSQGNTFDPLYLLKERPDMWVWVSWGMKVVCCYQEKMSHHLTTHHPGPSALLAVLSSPNPGISSVRMTEGGILCLEGRILLVGSDDPRQW